MAFSSEQSGAIVDVQWVIAHRDDPAVRLVEVDVSRAAYEQGHIPGAIHWDAYVDLRDPAYRPVSSPELQRLLCRSGITPETTIVFYGYAAPLGFWLMKAHGHGDVRMLDGPRDQWVKAGRQWTSDAPRPKESRYPQLREDADILALRQTVEDAIDAPGQVILDVRSEAEYQGERFWPSGATADTGRSGHIPGAVNVPIGLLLREDGTPKSVAELRRIFEDAGVTKDKTVITYCTIGNRASQAWFALKYELGYPSARVYYDSWAVWGKLSDTPIES
jgi:thiosulfate/3-mercaptopyruvate sulfurtransferase